MALVRRPEYHTFLALLGQGPFPHYVLLVGRVDYWPQDEQYGRPTGPISPGCTGSKFGALSRGSKERRGLEDSREAMAAKKTAKTVEV
eukprot:6795030-Pyramimonas_sp.AAC.1